MTVMPGVEIEPVVVEEIEQSLPCDYMDEKGCQQVARWIMFVASCCPAQGGQTLACDHCKEIRMTSEDGVTCESCGEFTAPARHAYSRIEPINRRA